MTPESMRNIALKGGPQDGRTIQYDPRETGFQPVDTSANAGDLYEQDPHDRNAWVWVDPNKPSQ